MNETTTTIRLFLDDALERQFKEKGYVKTGRIPAEAVEELTRLNGQLNIPDYIGLGYNVGMNSDQYALRKKMQDEIIRIVSPYALAYLDGYHPYSATYHNKDRTPNLFVQAHQDFTYSNENKVDPVMCWIPLVDVRTENAAMGFIPGSHYFYDYIRPFPFPIAKSPVTENEIRLMAYFDMVPMQAGEMIFFSHNIIHGSFANDGPYDRLAVGLNFVKDGEKVLNYILNPKTGGKTLLVYEVDTDFITRFNNPALNKMYRAGEIKLDVEPVDEIPYTEPDTSWEGIERVLAEHGVKPRPELLPLIERFNRQKRREQLKDKLYQVFSRFIPGRN